VTLGGPVGSEGVIVDVDLSVVEHGYRYHVSFENHRNWWYPICCLNAVGHLLPGHGLNNSHVAQGLP
jgi:hypothetical protein